jgi:hemin uptake protein HemP
MQGSEGLCADSSQRRGPLSTLEAEMDHNPKPSNESEHSDSSPKEYESSQLLHGAKEILIRHAGEVYRLRLTKNDKLILQK